jgi:hypothetical protein
MSEGRGIHRGPGGGASIAHQFCSTSLRNFEEESAMLWTPDLAAYLEDAPWPATKEELLDFANRTGAPMQVIENLQELNDEEGEVYESIEDIWPEASNHDLFYDEESEDF